MADRLHTLTPPMALPQLPVVQCPASAVWHLPLEYWIEASPRECVCAITDAHQHTFYHTRRGEWFNWEPITHPASPFKG